MRITGGLARGIPITTGKARHVRPATDRMREAVFSSLGGRLSGARFLDLFAGSGSYGLEALSRGAAGGHFVEKHPQAVAALKENLEAVCRSMGLGGPLPARIIRQDALRFSSGEVYSLVFMDPPYELARMEHGNLLSLAGRFLAPDGVIAYELPADLELPHSGWTCLRRIGKSGTNEPSVALLQKT